MSKKSAPEKELFPADPLSPWRVIPVHQKQTKDQKIKKLPLVVLRYQLCFHGKVHLTKGPGGLRTLTDMADFMNERSMSPKPKVACLADAGLPPLPKKPKVAEEQAATV